MLCLHTTCSIPANQELFLNYGPLSNENLLKLYGFVIPPSLGNPYNAVLVYTAGIDEGAEFYSLRVQLLNKYKIPSDASQPFKLTSSRIPVLLMKFLRVKLANSLRVLHTLDVSGCEHIDISDGTPEHEIHRAAMTELEMRCRACLLEILESLLSKYPHDFNADAELINNWSNRDPTTFFYPSER